MNTFYYATARFKMAVPDSVGDIDGGIVFPAGIPAHTLLRRDLDKDWPHLKNRLLDPQLYFAQISGHTCKKVCANLCSYGWFALQKSSSYDSSVQNQKDWRQSVMGSIHSDWIGKLPQKETEIRRTIEQCIQLQIQVGCGAIILPTPLSGDLGTHFSTELQWIDLGLEIGKMMAPDKKLLVTLALSDTLLRNIEPRNNDLITILIDQITARSVDGVYLVIEQTHETSYYCTHPHTVGSALRIIHELKAGGVDIVVVGPFGIAGYLTASVGADIWTAGYYRTERRVRVADCEDVTGRAYPTYYSHSLATEFHLESDLDTVVDAGLLDAVAYKKTNASAGLIKALKAGQPGAAVLEWEYRQANVNAATEHFMEVCLAETRKLNPLSADQRIAHTHDWLKNAAKLAAKISKLGNFNVRTELRHQSAWLNAYEDFMSAI